MVKWFSRNECHYELQPCSPLSCLCLLSPLFSPANFWWVLVTWGVWAATPPPPPRPPSSSPLPCPDHSLQHNSCQSVVKQKTTLSSWCHEKKGRRKKIVYQKIVTFWNQSEENNSDFCLWSDSIFLIPAAFQLAQSELLIYSCSVTQLRSIFRSRPTVLRFQNQNLSGGWKIILTVIKTTRRLEVGWWGRITRARICPVVPTAVTVTACTLLTLLTLEVIWEGGH